ncbi:hypothetical protein [Shewanella woodyi]|uniref:hypothetical protein n=1 Tax=Shewanella woodyi TaxID=60961 RepID=UPI0007EA8E38|nr:hypothetical protein [Shewanella woodyi]
MTSKDTESKEKFEMTTVKNEAIFFTGAALIGGTKLAYDVGKDIASKLKINDKIFIQLANSCFTEGKHLIRLHIANAYVHGLSIESVDIVDLNQEDFSVYTHSDIDAAGFMGQVSYSKESCRTSFPFILEPASNIDLYLKITKIEYEGIKSKRGVELVVNYCALDCLDSNSESKVKVRLFWPKEI